jgi:hypothetical protein
MEMEPMATRVDPSARRRETTELAGFQNALDYGAGGEKKEENPTESKHEPNDEPT